MTTTTNLKSVPLENIDPFFLKLASNTLKELVIQKKRQFYIAKRHDRKDEMRKLEEKIAILKSQASAVFEVALFIQDLQQENKS